jgi:hypothetical protein
VSWRGVDGDPKLKASASFSASRISVPDPDSATSGTTGSGATSLELDSALHGRARGDCLLSVLSGFSLSGRAQNGRNPDLVGPIRGQAQESPTRFSASYAG